MERIKKKYSLYSIALIFAFLLSIFFYYDLWDKNRVTLDAPSYYTYLPATIIHQDLKLNFIDKDPSFFKDKIWYYRIDEGTKLIKHPMGISVMLSPFFVAGHLCAKLRGSSQTGYSMPYQNAVSLGVLIYLFIGLYYLRKLLLQFFSEKITAVTLLCIGLGTNLLWYSSFEGLMPHAISFSLVCVALYGYYQWLNAGLRKHLLLFALAFALIVLVRPLAITMILYFLLHALISKGSFRSLFEFLKPQGKALLLSTFIFFFIVSLQLCYWKYITGQWIFDGYIDEHFVFSSPQMIPFLFSFRKGLFIYTPLMLFAVMGLVIAFKKNKAIFWATLLILSLSVFLLSSWWAWSYGICWGMRPMIDYYPILAIPMAMAFAFFFEKGGLRKMICSVVIVLLISLNLFQTWQYKNGLIHYDDMSKEAYFYGFFQTKSSSEWVDKLKPYNWERRTKGLPQLDFDQTYFEGLNPVDMIIIRAYNMQYLAANPKAQNAVAAFEKEVMENDNSLFHVERQNDGTVCLLNGNGLYLSVNAELQEVLTASVPVPGPTEKFWIEFPDENDNRILIKASNNKYLSAGNEFPFIITATGHGNNKGSVFRFFDVK